MGMKQTDGQHIGRALFDAVYPRAKSSFRTIKLLSDACGVSVGILSEARSGRRTPSAKVGHALAKAAQLSWTLSVAKDGSLKIQVGAQTLFPFRKTTKVCDLCGIQPKPRDACRAVEGRMVCRSCREKSES